MDVVCERFAVSNKGKCYRNLRLKNIFENKMASYLENVYPTVSPTATAVISACFKLGSRVFIYLLIPDAS